MIRLSSKLPVISNMNIAVAKYFEEMNWNELQLVNANKERKYNLLVEFL